MKKIVLKVRQPGLMFNIDGKQFRSPAEIDITHMKIDPIISQMRSYGIMDYEISTIENVTKLVKNKKDNSKSKIIIIENKTDDIDRLSLKIEKLEYMLNEIIKQNETSKEWEQNNKDVVSLSKKENKKPVIEKIINKPEPKFKVKEKIKTKTKVNTKDELSNKKIIIEELEECVDADIVDIKLETKVDDFKTKDFKYEENHESFKISSDIEKLKKYKK